jgi:hypothetical protein
VLRLLVLVVIAGCWPYRWEPEPTIPAVAKPRPKRTCKKLTFIAGDVPKRPNLEERCGHHVEDVDRYYCYQNELGWHVGALQWWIEVALTRCMAEPDADDAPEARAHP